MEKEGGEGIGEEVVVCRLGIRGERRVVWEQLGRRRMSRLIMPS